MASNSPPPSGRHDDVDEDPAVPAPAGEAGREGRGGRLRPAPPPMAHAPLLLGFDPEGGEHPQGPEHADDETLTGRAWGCGCGWRGAVRDVSTRPFHPRVGDGGGLRRQRLARSDRDSRAELEFHLAGVARPSSLTAPPAAPTATTDGPDMGPVLGPATGPEAIPGRGRPRGLRRRLTLPRTPATAEPARTPTAAAAAERERTPLASAAATAPEQAPNSSSGGPHAGDVPCIPPLIVGRGAAVSVPSLATHDMTPSARDEALAAAADRARVAREELEAADASLDAVVARARREGTSWRSIARATGVPHRAASARWGANDDVSTL